MPEVNVDDSKWELYRQCEIRRPCPPRLLHDIQYAAGYSYDIVWIKADLARTGHTVSDGEYHWLIFEVFGNKKMPGGGRFDFRGGPTIEEFNAKWNDI